MKRQHLGEIVVPAYVLLCLLIGGSVQGIWRNMVLQLVAIALLGWAALSSRPEPFGRAAKTLLLLAAATILLIVLQLIPLPPSLWTSLPGRGFVAEAYAALGYTSPWLPISLAPFDTLATALTLLPPLAILVGIIRLRAYETRCLTAAVLAGTFVNVLLGTMQSVGGGWPEAWWFLYENSNPGAVGFFANRNHMGTLLLVSIPFAIILFSLRASSAKAQKHAMIIAGASGLFLILLGLVLNHSLAAIVLAIPVVAASALLLPRGWRKQRVIVPAAAVVAMLAMVGLTSSPVRSELAGSDTSSLEIRKEIWTVTLRAVGETFPTGTGLGSFEQAYPLYEKPEEVDPTYINHAHNDFLELVMEAGAPGLLLILAFLVWWLSNVVKIWRSPTSNLLARAATIATGAILAHSIVDYPLRTAAIAAIFAACIALMAQVSERPPRAFSRDRDRPRHYVIG